jgi:hypothetical protein
MGIDQQNPNFRPLLHSRINPPHNLEDLRKLIGLLGFYQDWLDNYELRISRWRQHIKTIKTKEAQGLNHTVGEIWTEEDNQTMNTLLDELISRPILSRPNYTRSFYLKTDWCRLGMAAVLLQADPNDPLATTAEKIEDEGGPCAFDKSTHKLRLRPLAFASRRCSEHEGSLHSYTGEAATGVWAIEKHQRHLFGRELTWMTDCNGLWQFFDGSDVPTHSHQRMRQRLLRFVFTIVHRPAKFMIECDALTRYNRATELWRLEAPNLLTAEKPNNSRNLWAATFCHHTPVAIANEPIIEVDPPQSARTFLAQQTGISRTIWTVNAATTTITDAIVAAGVLSTGHIEDRQEWKLREPGSNHTHDIEYVTTDTIRELLSQDQLHHVDWIIAHDAGPTDSPQQTQHNLHLQTLIQIGKDHNLRGIVILTRQTPTAGSEHSKAMEQAGFHSMLATVKAHRYGAATEGEFTLIIATKQRDTLHTFHMQQAIAEPIANYIDQPDSGHHADTETEIHSMMRPNKQQDEHQAQVAAMVNGKAETNPPKNGAPHGYHVTASTAQDQTSQTRQTNGTRVHTQSNRTLRNQQPTQFAESEYMNY